MPKELISPESEDIALGDDIRESKQSHDKTGYPYDLTEDQIIRMVYFFGARKLSSKALKGGHATTTDFTSMEKRALDQMYSWFGYVVESQRDQKKAYGDLVLKFKFVLGFLKTHPAYLTRDVYNALKVAGYENVTKNVIFVLDEHRRIVPRLVANENQPVKVPLMNMDKLQWEIQNVALDKIMMIMQSITPADVKKANLGTKSKAVRDLHAMYHMSKLGNRNPNLSLVSINVNTATPQEKLSNYQSYIIKNRDE